MTGRRLCFVITNDISTVFYRGYLGYLRERGWNVTIISRDTGKLTALGEAEGVDIVDVDMVRDPSPIRDLRSLIRLTRAIRRVRPDVLVFSTPKASLLASVAGWLLRVPVRIYHILGLRYETESGMRRRVFRSLEKTAAGLATETLAVSHSLAELVREERLTSRVVVLGEGSPFGTDLRRFSPDALDIPALDADTDAFLAGQGAAFRLLFVGRITRDKGVGDLLDALALLADRGVEVASVIVGPGEDAGLERRIEDFAAEHAVQRVGSVADPRAYMRAVDMLCLPTLREGFGQVIVEAAGLGVPTITTQATGARDVVVDGETGLIVPVKDGIALAAAIERAVADRDDVRRWGSAARARAEEYYSTDRVWRQYADHFEGRLRAGEDSSDG
ncbi:N,N'-diacetylbacillosaminyl-diphospho-undecaprenol alpha-1,3-N-acetylgalactosaminyltransferase [Microbacterium azadirachtae]|uniref:N, N'-diacetylbacillosaminyl-diphospho-undecaprenol alpha-1,3-N-acetylgalactosaminyltransferase n=1 Tax=Microbacterium azadirachtae TaxID=582680 RepID=A0A0F0LML6_9MICO|nr:N,N'-diacetylbacillosaminyl-diphospho-undecaprenol alpha-1,3-N-acetylgalactosaminyltransferase [Microbacterium azadirachtae]